MRGISRRGFLTRTVGSLMIFPFMDNTQYLDEQQNSSAHTAADRKYSVHIQLIRHATLLIKVSGLTLLVDPMLSVKEEMEPVANAVNSKRIPMTALPMDDQALQNILTEVDAVLITHTHRDYWDEKAIKLLCKDKTIFCQPADEIKIRERGFTAVCAIEKDTLWQNIIITRTGGQHGTGETGNKMGPVSGFVLQSQNTPTLYIAGDTIWCPEVKEALLTHQPDITVVNAGAAQFLSGGPITMTAQDLAQVCKTLPVTKVMAVHMDTVNHCLLTRKDLQQFIKQEKLQDSVLIPEDGEVVYF